MFNFEKLKTVFKIDLLLFVSFVFFSLISLMTLFDKTQNGAFFDRQLIWIVLSCFFMLIFSNIDFSFLNKTKYVIYIYILSLLGLLATLIFGEYISGSRGWIDFGFFSVQPADFAKIAIIFLLAKYFAKRHSEIQNIKHIFMSILYVVIFVFVILLQPDLGSALVILSIWFGIVVFSGISKKHLLSFIVLGIALVTFAWFFVFKDFQKNRILNFVDPARDRLNSGYNVYQSQIAVGSGGIFGKGVAEGTQSSYSYLPESETDFIFAAFAEEWGFVGVCIFFIIYIIFIFRLMFLSYHAQNNFNTFVIMGFVFWILTHFVVNVGMNIGVMPVTGIPLPFVSYGGSHFLSESIMLGIILSLSKSSKINTKRYYKNEFYGLG